jgi:hypothetical protein
MQATDRAHAIERMLWWLQRTNPLLAGMPIDAQTDIIDSRILESLQVVEFILFLEAESGRTILAEDLNPDDLRTLDSIYRRFFSGGA